MAAAADGYSEVVLACKAYCLDYIVSADAASNKRRTPVDRAVPHTARVIVTLLTRPEECASETQPQV
jgi:hypothetical protein